MYGKHQWPPYEMFETTVEGEARRKLDKLERLYHVGQEQSWNGREVLAALIAKHGPPRFDDARRDPALRLFSILLWGELAAWAISADLAERLTDVEAKMAATSQAHDEARHFYVLRDYLRATGYAVPHLGGLSRNLLAHILRTDNLAHKLVGMQLLVESNALGLFKGLRDAKLDPVLTELLPYYERDEARHVGLGVLYLPRILAALSTVERWGLMAFQARAMATLIAGGLVLHDDFVRLGFDQRGITEYTLKIQSGIFDDMRANGPRGALRGLFNVGRDVANPQGAKKMGRKHAKNSAPNIVELLHPVGDITAGHAFALRAATQIGRVADRML